MSRVHLLTRNGLAGYFLKILSRGVCAHALRVGSGQAAGNGRDRLRECPIIAVMCKVFAHGLLIGGLLVSGIAFGQKAHPGAVAEFTLKPLRGPISDFSQISPGVFR